MRTIGKLMPVLLLAASLLAALISGCGSREEWVDTDQEYALRLSLSTNRIYVGGVLEAELEILHPEDVRPVFSDPGDGEELIVRDRSWDSRELPDGRHISSVRYRISSFQLGEHRIFKGKLKLMRAEQQIAELDFGENLVSVESLLKAGGNEMRDIAACRPFPARFPRWLPVLLLIAVLAALAGALVARLLRRRVSTAELAPPPPADEVALRELRVLREKNWIEEGRAEPFYVELSRIVRKYIEGRFGLRAPELTTEEFIRAAAESEQLSLDHRQLTGEFLRQSDMVKFARYRPAAEPMEEAYQSAERLVHETSRPAENAEGGGAE